MKIGILFPHQLFEENPILEQVEKVYLIEETLFFNQYKFHKQKLTFHRASMKFYESFLLMKGIEVGYIEAKDERSDIRQFIKSCDAKEVAFIDPVDNYLSRRLKDSCIARGILLKESDSPAFINTQKDLSIFFKPSKKRFFQTEFYKLERKRLNLLMDSEGEPMGGKWTFDSENRKKYPVKKVPPSLVFPDKNSFFEAATDYVNTNFAKNYGKQGRSPFYPTDFKSAKSWLKQFLENRFPEFGDYEDAIVSSERILNHSVLSPLINVGLLTPDYVIGEIVRYAEFNEIAINNTEGIVRQIIGWREFIRGIYEVKGTEERTKNFWGFTRKIPDSFYDGTTGIEPVDNCIKKLLDSGYSHHIERLMVLGNFMLLCEIDPNEVYRWFMELYIDAYDWVMVPNVYGMSQFADGGLMSTKPYISGSNYLMKMGDYKKGAWQQTWDALFWRFMHVHRDFFLANPRLGMLVRTFDKMSDEKRSTHLSLAERFIEKLDA